MNDLSNKFIKKYMRIAKLVGEDQNPCYSRKIGVVIVDPKTNSILSTGYNGPPKNTPHTDDPCYLSEVFFPALNQQEVEVVKSKIPEDIKQENKNLNDCELITRHFANCHICPRRLINAPSGSRLDLCSCSHAERNAVTNSNTSLLGSYMFCWCGVPCWECTQTIINAQVEKVFCIDWGVDYSRSSRWLFHKAEIPLFIEQPEWYLVD